MNDASLVAAAGVETFSVYAAVGRVLTRYALNAATGELEPCESVSLPENVQYAWPHRSRRFLYVASSSGVPAGTPRQSDRHRLTALAIDPVSGALTEHGPGISLPARPIHISTDIPSRFLLVAFNDPAGLQVYAIRPDGTLGAEVAQLGGIDAGIYPHQVRATPDNSHVIVVARGNDAEPGKAEDPGSLRIFRFEDGRLTAERTVAPSGGFGFGPRHLDFHPFQPWAYVSVERQNRLDMFDMRSGVPGETPLYTPSTLSASAPADPRQLAGAIRVHPNGLFVYVSNRASTTKTVDGRQVFVGGQNSIAVFAIDEATGEPVPVQHIDTRGIHCRNFQIDPSGSLLIASHIVSLPVPDDGGLRTIPARLSVFRIGKDGRLTFMRHRDVELAGETMFWMGTVERPATHGNPPERPMSV